MTPSDNPLSLDDILGSFKHHSARDWTYVFITNRETCDASGITESDYVSHSYITNVSEDRKVFVVRNIGKRNYRSLSRDPRDSSKDRYFDEFLVTLATKDDQVVAQFDGESLREVYEKIRASVQRYSEENESYSFNGCCATI